MTGRSISRRTLLLGAAGAGGLAAGIGGDELVRAAGGSASTQTHAPSPGEELMVEHGVLKRLLLAYRAMHDRLTGTSSFRPGILTDAAQIMSDYVEGFHEGLEEAYVFPRVAHAEPTLIRTLLDQHDRGRHLTAAIQDAAAGGFATPATRATLAAHLSAFVRMYEPHEAWEDTVVYPALRRLTSQRTLDELADRFATLENRQYGDQALTTILDRVAGVEKELGINDLATFTPPQP